MSIVHVSMQGEFEGRQKAHNMPLAHVSLPYIELFPYIHQDCVVLLIQSMLPDQSKHRDNISSQRK